MFWLALLTGTLPEIYRKFSKSVRINLVQTSVPSGEGRQGKLELVPNVREKCTDMHTM